VEIQRHAILWQLRAASHSRTGPVRLNNYDWGDTGDRTSPTIRFSSATALASDNPSYAYNEYTFNIRSCSGAGSGTTEPFQVYFHHDGLVDVINYASGIAAGETHRINLQAIAHVRRLEKIEIKKVGGSDSMCLNWVQVRFEPPDTFSLFLDERPTTISATKSATYSVNASLHSCDGCATTRRKQGFALALHSTHKLCASNVPPSTQVDASCNVTDEDCDGRLDDDFVGTPRVQHQGICQCTTTTSCVDGSVRPAPNCVGASPKPREISGNGLDDDCDGTRDEAETEHCSDGFDNDADQRADCADSDCEAFDACRTNPGGVCNSDRSCDNGLPCIEGQCRAPHCDNDVKDHDEVGTDCGGADCKPCDGRQCESSCRVGERTTPPALASLRFASGTFTRTTTGTFESSPGRLETARPNELRWVSANGARLALFEGVSSNVARWSSEFGHAPEWVMPAGSAMALTADGAQAPDGSMTADLLRSAGGAARGPAQDTSLMAARWNLSLYARSATEDFGGVRQTRLFVTAPNHTVLTTKTSQIFDDWGRIDLPVTPAAAGALSFGISHAAGWPTTATPALRAPDLAVWGAQLEILPFPTSYIAATSATVTRRADVLTVASAQVPWWLGTGLWQVDVMPEFSSAELITNWRHTVVSYNANNDIALVASPNAGKARLSIKHGTATFNTPDLIWERGAVLRLTFDMRSNGSRGVTISGAEAGNGTFAVANLAHPAATLRVGGILNGTGEAFAAIGEPRRIDRIDAVCAADAACTCGNGSLENGETCDPALATCNAQCDQPIHEICVEDRDCPTGQACAAIGDRIDRDPSFRYCWPIDPCTTNPAAACGTVDSVCGLCVCQPDCSDAVCGASNDNGCDASCPDVCPDGGPDCQRDSDCGLRHSCGFGEGTAFDLPAGSNVCWPQYCEHPRSRLLHCGSVDAPCGKCPEPSNDCGTRECGDDGRGHSCGRCDTGSVCDESGQCVVRSSNPLPNDVGSLPGSFAVDESGAANYTIPIVVPPGRAGLTPQLALSYRSSSGHGYVGRGWSLTGLSGISRCPRTFAQDGFARGIQNTAADAFCLDGKRLVALSGRPYGGSGTEYRTELDSFLRIISRGNPAPDGSYAGPEYFEVYDKSGRKRTYGRTDVARVQADLRDPEDLSLSEVNVSWMLEHIDDTSGNRIRVHYERDVINDEILSSFPSGSKTVVSHVAEIRPKTIFYGDGLSHFIEFHYDDDNVHVGVRSYRGGAARHVSSPLTEISTALYAGPNRVEVRRYKLASHFSGEGWLLDSVTGCAADAAGERCMPPTRFSYRETEPDASAQATEDEVGFIPVAPKYRRRESFEPWNFGLFDMFAFDHDGDGAQDLLHSQWENKGWYDDEYRLYLRKSKGEMRGQSAFHAVGAELGSRCKRVLGVLDFDDDGRDDVIAQCYTTWDQLEYFREARLLRSTDDGFHSEKLQDLVEGDIPKNEKLDDLSVADLDGDGRLDLVGTEHDDDITLVKTWRNVGRDGRYAFVPAATTHVPDEEARCQAFDWDGDKAAEVVCGYDKHPSYNWHSFRRAQVFGLERSALASRADFALNGVDIFRALKLDANGDGITDLIFENSDYIAELHLGTGRGYKYATRTPRAFGLNDPAFRYPNSYGHLALFVFDIDADGKQEILEGNPDTRKWELHRPYSFGEGETVSWTHSTETSLPYYAPKPRDEPSFFDKYAHPIALDWDGDGVLDAVQRAPGPFDGVGPAAKYPRFQLLKATPPTKWLLQGIDEGSAKSIAIAYEVTPDDYVPGDEDDCVYPQRCLKALPTPVVTWHQTTGAGGLYRDPAHPEQMQITHRFEYAYEDARADVHGRGWLGFGKRSIKQYGAFSEGLLSETTVTYDLEAYDEGLKLHYRAGRPVKTVTRVVTSGPSLNGEGETSHVGVTTQQLELRTSGAGRPYVAPAHTQTESLVAHGGGLTTASRRDAYLYDEFGNVRFASTAWSDGRWQSASTTYARTASDGSSLTDKWMVALPEEVSVSGRAQEAQIELVPRGYKMKFAYNHRGLVESAEKSGAAGVELRTEFGYDTRFGGQFGNVTSRTIAARDALERTDTIRYDALGIYPAQISNTTYEEADVPYTVVDYDERTGALTYVRRPDNSWSRQNYDAFGRLRSMESDAGMSTAVDYLRGGTGGGVLRVRTHGAGQPTSETEYNAFGQVVRSSSQHWGGAGSVQARTSVQEYGYDERGRLRTATVPHLPGAELVVQSYDYDNLNRLTKEVAFWQDESGTPRPIATKHLYGYRPLIPLADDPLPWAALSAGVAAHATESPAQPRSVSVTDQRGNTVATLDANGGLTTFAYGAFDDLQKVNALGNVTTYARDNFGRVKVMVDADTGRHGYTYNGLDQVRTYERNIASSIGESTSYQYDFMGRLHAAHTPDGVHTWEYDGYDGDLSDPTLIGHLAEESLLDSPSGSAHTRFAYGGPGGALTSTQRTIDGQTFDSHIEYDGLGRPIFLRYPVPGNLFAIQYKYQSTHGRLEEVLDVSSGSSSLWKLEDVDAFGNSSKVRFGNGVVTTRDYERATGKLSLTTVKSSPTETVHNEQLYYDERGLLKKRTRFDGSWVESYSHDALGRLKTRRKPARLGSGVESFGYSDDGNLTCWLDGRSSCESAPENLHYDDEAHPHQLQRTDDGRSFGYDAHGRQVVRKGTGIPGGLQGIIYSSFDLPLEVRTARGASEDVTRYSYDAHNKRVVRQDPDNTKTLYVGDLYEQTTLPMGGLEQRIRIPTPDGLEIEANLTSGGINYRYLSSDGLGSPAAVTNGEGDAVALISHNPFGSPEMLRHDDENVRASFTGHEHDSTGLINMRGRMYDAAVGRFLTPDPLVQAPGYSQNWNRYSYVFNSPLYFTDPSGFEATYDVSSLPGSTTVTVTETRLPEADTNPLGADPGSQPNGGATDIPPLADGEVGPVFPDQPGPAPLRPTAAVPLALAISNGIDSAVYSAADTSLASALGAFCAWQPYVCGLAALLQAEGEDQVAGPVLMMVSAGAAPSNLGRAEAVAGERVAARGGETVFRVQGGVAPNASKVRFLLGADGRVAIAGEDMLFVNLGQEGRALEFLAKRGETAQLVRFQVTAQFAAKLRGTAVPQRLGRQFPGAPQAVDATRAADQFGIPASMFDELLNNIVPGTFQAGRP
jgi:RHS repeat-associated protein